MEKPDRNEKDAAQKAKLIFLSIAAVVIILLIVSLVTATRARSERTAALNELELIKQDNAKLSKWLEERTREVEEYKNTLDKCQAKVKQKAEAKSKTPAKSKSTKKKSTKSRSR